MNFKNRKSWTKHLDFIIVDLISLQLAFLFAYWVRHGIYNPYRITIYRNVVIVLVLIQLMVSIFTRNFKSVLRRGTYKEFIATGKQVILVTLLSTFYLFLLQEASVYSRITMLLMGTFYLILSLVMRLSWKTVIRKQFRHKERRKALIVVTTEKQAEQVIQSIHDRNYHDYLVSGIILLDVNRVGEEICDVEVVACAEDAVNFVCRSWVDELYIDVDRSEYLPQQLLDDFNEMGVTVHLKLQNLDNPFHRKQYVEKMMGVTVMTYSVNDIPEGSLFIKRFIDIMGGLMGCILTGLLILFIGPMIYFASPGPIFFSQKRVGQNGKCFKMYKFRSMYLDAEARKAELMAQNEVQDGMMFKIENDPRIIKGIGHFIRKTSLDEFPQFFNVLKGDMSLVGTRPPTMDEWVKYDLHHRLRMAMRPGITGMWQVSGRSDIKDFEEVVKLDAEYISQWNLGLDIKILFKTVAVIFKGDGAR